MGHNASGVRAPRALISVDWIVLSVAILALALLLLTMARNPSTEVDPIGTGGLQVLGPDDTLVAFQDFTFGADGWDPAITEDRLAGLGPVLGRFMDETVSRTVALPPDTAAATLRFDLHLAGNWTPEGAIVVQLNGAEIVRIPWPEGQSAPSATDADDITLRLQQFTVTPRPDAAALPGPTGDLASYAIELRIADPGDELQLDLAAAMPVDSVGASWALDNVRIIALAGE